MRSTITITGSFDRPASLARRTAAQVMTLFGVLGIVATTGLTAQQAAVGPKAPAEKVPTAKAPVEKVAEAKAPAPKAPSWAPKLANVNAPISATLRLTNGQRLQGVINGPLVRPVGGGRYRMAAANDPAAGVRLGLGGGLGFIFVRSASIRSLTNDGPAPAAAKKTAPARARVATPASRRMPLRAKKPAPARETSAVSEVAYEDAPGREAPDTVRSVSEIPLTKLFNRFHPNLGWYPGRLAQIEWRKTTLGVFPGRDEREWIAAYDEWLPQYLAWYDVYAR